MRVYEAHIWLASTIGDSIVLDRGNITNNDIIPDGVRYSKDLRDSYLYRAMLDTYKTIIGNVVSLPKQVASQVLFSMLPNMIRELAISPSVNGDNLNLDIFGTSKPLYIMSIEATDLDGNRYPIPVRDHYKGTYLKNSRNVQRHDAFCTLVNVNGTTLLNYYDALNIECELVINYIPYPVNPGEQLTTDEILYEERYIPLILAKSASYALADSQDIQNQETFLRLTMEQNNANQ